MSEQFKQNSSSVPPQAESDMVVLIKKMQQHLVLLERKIDTLISQSQQPQERPFREKRFAKPFRSFGPSHPRARGEYNNSFREPRAGGFPQGRPFKKHDRPERDENRGFSHKKKPFYQKRNDRG